jgi:hypothetical protein
VAIKDLAEMSAKDVARATGGHPHSSSRIVEKFQARLAVVAAAFAAAGGQPHNLTQTIMALLETGGVLVARSRKSVERLVRAELGRQMRQPATGNRQPATGNRQPAEPVAEMQRPQRKAEPERTKNAPDDRGDLDQWLLRATGGGGQ